MLRSQHRHPYRPSYGLHHSHRIRSGRIRYPRSRLPYRQTMIGRPIFYRTPAPAKQHGFFGGLLAMLAALFCLNRQPNRPAISSGSGEITSGGGGTIGGGSSSCGGGSCVGGGGGCGGGGGNCGGGGGTCGGSGGNCGGGGGTCGSGGGGGGCGGGGD